MWADSLVSKRIIERRAGYSAGNALLDNEGIFCIVQLVSMVSWPSFLSLVMGTMLALSSYLHICLEPRWLYSSWSC